MDKTASWLIMEPIQAIKNGKEIWIIELKHAWTGSTVTKKFPTKELAAAWLKTRDAEKK